MLSKPEMDIEGNKYGISNITDEEYERNKAYSLHTALTRIKNSRSKIADKLNAEKVKIKCVLLGGRDFVYKKLEGGLENSKSQIITVLEETPEGKAKLSDVTIWGHLENAHHGDGVEAEITIRTGKETEDGRKPPIYRTIDGRNKNSLIVKREKVISDKESVLNMMSHISKDIGIKTNHNITENDIYTTIAFRGKITNSSKCKKWEDGQPIDDIDTYFNDQPCLQLMFAEEGTGKRMRATLQPSRLSKAYILWPDLYEIAKTNSEIEIIESVVGRELVAIGTVRNVKQQDVTYFELDATCLIPIDEYESLMTPKEPITPTAPAQTTITTNTLTPLTITGNITKSELPPVTTKGNAQERLVAMMASVRSAMDTLGTTITPDDLYNLGIFDKTKDNPKILEKIIERVQKETTPK